MSFPPQLILWNLYGQRVPQNVKSVSLKRLVEHVYLEDRRYAILELATSQNIALFL